MSKKNRTRHPQVEQDGNRVRVNMSVENPIIMESPPNTQSTISVGELENILKNIPPEMKIFPVLFCAVDVIGHEHMLGLHHECRMIADLDEKSQPTNQALVLDSSTTPPQHFPEGGPSTVIRESNPSEGATIRSALQPLAKIADAYDANCLDDEARKFWGPNLEYKNCKPPHAIEIYTSRGGATLLTLADCIKAREVLQSLK